MEEFVKGDVVVVPFPFSDLTDSKRRPALVVATLKGEDVILCLITSVQREDESSVRVSNNDFKSGTLNSPSMVRVNRMFTADKAIILYKAGSIKEAKIKETEAKIVQMFRK